MYKKYFKKLVLYYNSNNQWNSEVIRLFLIYIQMRTIIIPKNVCIRVCQKKLLLRLAYLSVETSLLWLPRFYRDNFPIPNSLS